MLSAGFSIFVPCINMCTATSYTSTAISSFNEHISAFPIYFITKMNKNFFYLAWRIWKIEIYLHRLGTVEFNVISMFYRPNSRENGRAVRNNLKQFICSNAKAIKWNIFSCNWYNNWIVSHYYYVDDYYAVKE